MRLMLLAGVWLAIEATHGAAFDQRPLARHEASRVSMACLYAIEAYGADARALPSILEEAFDEVDRIDRLMSHYKADSALSAINRHAARAPVVVGSELFEFIAEAMRYQRESGGAFDITVGPLMKAWGFFSGEGRLPTSEDLANARRQVGGDHILLDAKNQTIFFKRQDLELDLGGIAKGYAVDRIVDLLRRRGIEAALISAGGSTIYGLGTPPALHGWTVTIQDPLDSRKAGLELQLENRALSVSGISEKSFEAGGVTYSHLLDPRTGWPVQGVLSVAVLANSGTAGDALDTALAVLGPEQSRAYLATLRDVDAFFFLPESPRHWTMVRIQSGS